MGVDLEPGVAEKSRSNAYVAELIGGCSWPNKNRNGLTQTLLARPDFINDDVWLLFKLDGTAEHCLASADKYLTNAQESWQTVLVSFANQGILDRGRLLDESLRALSRDFNQFRAGWFSRFHEALEPTHEERAQRLEAYLQLLNSAVPPTVSFALAMVLSVNKSSPIPFQALKAHLPGTLSSKSKNTVLGAIKLLHICAEREPKERRAICMLACTSLVSEIAEVQNQVIKLLLKFAEKHDVELHECARAYTPALSASVRANLPDFLKSSDEDVSRDAQHKREFPLELSASQARPLKPIADLNDLVLKAAFVVEHPEAYCDYELVLDGILRYSSRDQADFAMRTSSLLQHTRKLQAKTAEFLTRALCQIISAWIADERPDASPPPPFETAFREFHRQRLQALTERVLKRETLPLLSLPTDEYGWLEAEELRCRLGAAAQYDPWDRCLALLRLRNADSAVVDLAAGESTHPALVSLRDRLKDEDRGGKYSMDWSITSRTTPHGYTFTGISLSPDPATIFPASIDLNNSSKAPNPWGLSAQEVLMAGSMLPNLREVYFAFGAHWLGRILQYTEVADKSARHYLRFLHDPATVPGRLGSLLVVLSVSTEDQDISVAGVDAFIMLIAEQRFDFALTAEAMHKLFHHGDCIKANRWAKHFGAIARASSLHSQTVYKLLQQVLSTSLKTPPRDLHCILELLVELRAEHNEPLQPETASCLAGIKAGGKTKKLIDQLELHFS